MALDRIEIKQLYQRRAKLYDLSANAYYLIGFRELAYRKRAVDALNLKEGDTVVEVGCGTGLNFDLLRWKVGPKGKIIGVDLTPEMLQNAERRILRNNWKNVQLIRNDAAEFQFPDRVGGIISTFAITLIPEFDKIIRNGAAALNTEGRFVILDFRMPDSWPIWLVKLFVLMASPFGVSLDLADRHPWESIDPIMTIVKFEKFYYGLVYLCVGEVWSD